MSNALLECICCIGMLNDRYPPLVVFSVIMALLLTSVLLTSAIGVTGLYVLQGLTPLLSVQAITWLVVSRDLRTSPGSILAAIMVPAGAAASFCCTMLLTMLYAWLVFADEGERCFKLAVGLKVIMWLFGLCQFRGARPQATTCQLKPSAREMEGFGSETVGCCAEP